MGPPDSRDAADAWSSAANFVLWTSGGEDDAGEEGPQVGVASPMEIQDIFEDPVWAEVYVATCADMAEQPSLKQARAFHDSVCVQNPGPSPERLSLRNLRIGAAAVSCLATQLKDRTYTRVDLGDNQLGEHALLSVRSLIRALPRLQWLGLSGNLIGADGARELAEELQMNESLECLVLGTEQGLQLRGPRPNAIGSEGLRAMLEAVDRNCRTVLSSLALSTCSLDASAGKHLAAFLAGNRTLSHLDLAGNPLTSEGVCALLPQCSRLRMLSIADTACRGDLIHSQLSTMLQSSRCLAHLSLAKNTLEVRPLRRIARAVAGCESLVSLSLEQTSIDAEGVSTLVDALLAAPAPNLTELDLSDNQITQAEAATALAHALTHSALHVLRLSGNPFGDAGARELGDALDVRVLAGDRALQRLELSRCRIGTLGAGHLFACLEGNKSLHFVDLSDNFVDSSLDVVVVEKLTHTYNIVLEGNRLSHIAMQRIEAVCTRNRQRARDEVPNALRADMHRLLFQETKLDQARRQVGIDGRELQRRWKAADDAAEQARQLRATEAEIQRQLSKHICDEEDTLDKRRGILVGMYAELESSSRHHSEKHQAVKRQLLNREEDLVDLRVAKEQLDEHFARRRIEHPEQVAAVKARIRAAVADTSRLQETARETRQRLKALQEEALIDFRP